MKALAITLDKKHVILRGAERCTKGNMMKLLMAAGNETWRNDEKIRSHYSNYAEFVGKLMQLKPFFKVTKIDIHFNRTFGKWVVESRYWMGKYSEDDIIFADVEENYRPFAPMD